MTNVSQLENDPVFQLKGSLFTLTVLHLLKAAETEAFASQLKQLVNQTPKFFHYIPMVLDLQKVNTSEEPVDFTGIMACMRELNVIPVGVRGGNPQQHSQAQQLGLAVFPNAKSENIDKSNMKPVRTATTAKVATQQQITSSKLVTTPVRSGQQIYARNADLIVLAPVSPGAELLADGHIHVYGTLRGRALAGVNGNQDARIFCNSLEADLVSIAGHYWVSEDLQNSPVKQNVHIYLKNERLQVGTL